MRVFRVCDKCGKEIEITKSFMPNNCGVITFVDCRKCNARNDVWVRIEPINK